MSGEIEGRTVRRELRRTKRTRSVAVAEGIGKSGQIVPAGEDLASRAASPFFLIAGIGAIGSMSVAKTEILRLTNPATIAAEDQVRDGLGAVDDDRAKATIHHELVPCAGTADVDADEIGVGSRHGIPVDDHSGAKRAKCNDGEAAIPVFVSHVLKRDGRVVQGDDGWFEVGIDNGKEAGAIGGGDFGPVGLLAAGGPICRNQRHSERDCA